jgi:two-component system LytT family response regulator
LKKLKILVIDDEQPARSKIQSFLKGEERVEWVMEAEDGREAVEAIIRHRPDLVFLDIQMPGMDGFEVIKAVGLESMPAVVFVTAFDEYAIAAFEVQAVDYLLKPYDQDRFGRSFDRAWERIRSGEENATLFTRLLEEVKTESRYLKRILVRKRGRYFFVRTEDVIYVSAEEKYVNIHTQEGKHLIRETLIGIEERLDPSRFARIHRSHIVNLDYVKEIQPWTHGDSIVILTNEEKLFLSRRYRDRLL